ncbi:DUF5700 domain-containing putative Zn-dependent protease [Roseisolibacter agri]|uniref:DUF2268 domain-containing protein n=1 Tax=Roseisolibacter agri TaxID=2014610 RepID=A0AA37QD76_9BACT|nr:DUF5700 domain-containing putative Zn-dependent protease [Roseisolibacter agri]GLC23588.1 hypothetical protein rosag_01010 [Roseisolibacter agri]
MRPILRLLTAAPMLGALACATPRAAVPPSAPLAVRTDLAEAEAAVAVLDAQAAGRGIPDDLWARLTATAGYRRLGERERGMGRPFTDSAFRAFLTSDTLRARHAALRDAVQRWRTVDVRAAAARAAAYLPAGTPLRATLYPVIKPRDNSFVWDLDGDPAFFVYVDPAEPPARLENVVAHELHHVGYAAACRDAPPATATGPDSLRAARRATARLWAGAFGEGLAMLAAAGGPDAHPQAASEDSVRVRWDRDVANAPADMAKLAAFFTDVLEGRLDAPGAARERAAAFYGEQGPWYTVGYVMARTIETTHGRARLLRELCDPGALLATYDAAAARAGLPRWPAAVLAGLAAGPGGG